MAAGKDDGVPENDGCREENEVEEEDEACCLLFAFGRLLAVVAMFLTRMSDRAAPQSTKAKVALFHNFILERGGALRRWQEKEEEKKKTNVTLRLRNATIGFTEPDVCLFIFVN